MTEKITIHPYNASRIKLDAELHIYQALYDHFAYRPEGYRYMPSFKNKQWDGYLRLFDLRSRTLPLGLLHRLQKFAELSKVEVDFNKFNYTYGNDEIELDDIQQFADSLNIHSKNEKIVPHDYQIDTVFHAISNGRTVAIAPTSAGKSLILYIYLQWFMQKYENKKLLLIVPSVTLVHQMYGDFIDYQTLPEGETTTALPIDKMCHTIVSGKEKYTNQPLTISTWQSLQNLAKSNNKEYFKQWNVVCVDEVHSAKGKVLSQILDLCTEAHDRLGVTGTLDGTELMQLQLEGIFGPVYNVITTKELMDRGAVSNIDIKCLTLDYPDEVKKNSTKLTYQEELDYVVTHPGRLKFTANLALSLKGNTLVLVNFVEKHGQPLYEKIKEKAGNNRKVFFIHGQVDGELRNEIRAIVENEENAIIIASFGTMSTGVSIKRLHNVIFASPSKGQIRVLQSIGRGLRISKNKSHCTLYDIGDDLSWKKHKNYLLEHLIERITMYNKQQFNYKLIRIAMKE